MTRRFFTALASSQNDGRSIYVNIYITEFNVPFERSMDHNLEGPSPLLKPNECYCTIIVESVKMQNFDNRVQRIIKFSSKEAI